MNKYIFGTISSAILGLILVSCNSGDDYNTAPPRVFPNLAMGKCDSYNVTLESSIYKIPKGQSITFNSTLITSLAYWERDSQSDGRFDVYTQDNPGGWYNGLTPHANDCTLGTIEGIYGNSRGGSWDNKLMIFSSCQPKLESKFITESVPNHPSISSNLTFSFTADYRIESPEDYNAESPMVLRSGKIHFTCAYFLQDKHGNHLPTK